MRSFLALFLLSNLLFGNAVGTNTKTLFPDDAFNPEVLRIDERRFLGNFVPNVELLLEDGRRTRLYELFADKPVILLLSYYTCEGTCPVRIDNLKKLIETTPLKERDFKVLVLSFDERDDLQKLKKFKESREPFTEHWVFGILPKEEAKKLTESVGFKFFFSERDKTFVHPNVYVFLSPEGRITRYLYGVKPSERDIRIALAESTQNKITLSSFVDLAYLVCYTYDPSRSRYVVNPTLLFGGIGFSALGLVLVSAFLINKLARKEV
ncbi:MAG: SCO family protein [Aquificae bacterium]|nr:SCO family protein [Aquificota bacterium]